MASTNDVLLAFHHHRNFEDDCIKLLNSEWPRSRAVRLRSLARSCDELPVALLFLLPINETSSSILIGHACLCNIPGRPNDCWIQSVIVDPQFRGRGYGKRLMLSTERYAKDNYDFKTAYLSTPDKRAFYEGLGYEVCDPIINVGANSKLLDNETFRKFTKSMADESSTGIRIGSDSDSKSAVSGKVPPPPPPPPILAKSTAPTIVFMRKQL